MVRLSESQGEAVRAIVGAPEAWSRWDDLDGGVLDELVSLGVVARWERPDYPAATLTPWGAWLAGAVLVEVLRKSTEVRTDRDDARPLAAAVVTESVLVETPKWLPRDRDELGDPRAWDEPVTMPPYARLGTTLVKPAAVVDRRPGPVEEFLRDEDGRAVVLLGGAPVRIDRRLRGKGA